MKTIEELRNVYYDVIRDLINPLDVANSLPDIEFDTFIDLTNGISSMLQNDLNQLISLFKSETNVDMQNMINEEINLIMTKQKILQQKRMEYETNQKLEQQSLNDIPKRIIFAKTLNGDTYFSRDLKNIPSEYYEDILDLLDKLSLGIKEANIEKERPIINNRELKGLYEKKGFKTRLIFRNLTEDICYVMQVRIKKDDNSLKDRRELLQRKENTEAEYKQIKELIKNPDVKQQLLMENDQIKIAIFDAINEIKRGQK